MDKFMPPFKCRCQPSPLSRSQHSNQQYCNGIRGGTRSPNSVFNYTANIEQDVMIGTNGKTACVSRCIRNARGRVRRAWRITHFFSLRNSFHPRFPLATNKWNIKQLDHEWTFRAVISRSTQASQVKCLARRRPAMRRLSMYAASPAIWSIPSTTSCSLFETYRPASPTISGTAVPPDVITAVPTAISLAAAIPKVSYFARNTGIAALGRHA